MNATDCRPSKYHSWSKLSGWCHEGCGVRNDKRVTHRQSGEVILPGATYTPSQLEAMQAQTTALYLASLAA
jgi:hypothetical protein